MYTLVRLYCYGNPYENESDKTNRVETINSKISCHTAVMKARSRHTFRSI